MEKKYALRHALASDTTVIKQLIAEFELDGAGFETEQFIVADKGGEVIGIGRVREHSDCSEACTLGVKEGERKNGIARELMLAMMEKAKQKDKLYLVCIIPEFFYPLGFEITDQFIPEKIIEKLHRCETELSVPEKYVVMKLKGQV